MKPFFRTVLFPLFFTALTAILLFSSFAVCYRRPCKRTVERYAKTPALAFAIIKAESGFHPDAVSKAGAVGLMQLMPATAKFVCERENIAYEASRLTEKEYNVTLGCLYLNYLLEKFSVTKTALCAYNAGEKVISEWLNNTDYSPDGRTITQIPYPETRNYVKKVEKYQKIYAFFDG